MGRGPVGLSCCVRVNGPAARTGFQLGLQIRQFGFGFDFKLEAGFLHVV